MLLSDNGSQFKSHLFKNMTKEYGIKHWLNANYHSQTNPAERVNKVVEASVRAYLEEDQREWDLYLQQIACAIRTSCHESTKFSPYKINFGREMIMFGPDHEKENDVRDILTENEPVITDKVMEDKIKLIEKIDTMVKQNIHKAYDRYSHYYNLRSKVPKFKVGDIVYKKNFILSDAAKGISAKLAPRTIKCRISKQMGSNTYELINESTGKKLGIYHSKDLS